MRQVKNILINLFIAFIVASPPSAGAQQLEINEEQKKPQEENKLKKQLIVELKNIFDEEYDDFFETTFNSEIEHLLDEGKIEAAMSEVLNNLKTYHILYTNQMDKTEDLKVDADCLDQNHQTKNMLNATSDTIGILGSLVGLVGGIALMTVPGAQIAAPFGIASGVANASSFLLKGGSTVVNKHLDKLTTNQYNWLVQGAKLAERTAYQQLLNIDKWLAFEQLKQWDASQDFTYISVFGQALDFDDSAQEDNSLSMVISGIVKLGDAVFNWRSMKQVAAKTSQASRALTSEAISTGTAGLGGLADDAAAAVLANQAANAGSESAEVIANTTNVATQTASTATAAVSNYQMLVGGFGCVASVVGLVTYSRSLIKTNSDLKSGKQSPAAEKLRSQLEEIKQLKAPKFFFEKFISIEQRLSKQVAN